MHNMITFIAPQIIGIEDIVHFRLLHKPYLLSLHLLRFTATLSWIQIFAH